MTSPSTRGRGEVPATQQVLGDCGGDSVLLWTLKVALSAARGLAGPPDAAVLSP